MLDVHSVKVLEKRIRLSRYDWGEFVGGSAGKRFVLAENSLKERTSFGPAAVVPELEAGRNLRITSVQRIGKGPVYALLTAWGDRKRENERIWNARAQSTTILSMRSDRRN